MHHMCAHTKKIAEQGPLALPTTPGEGRDGVRGALVLRDHYIYIWK